MQRRRSVKLGKWRATPGTDLKDWSGTDLPSSGSPGCINPFPGDANRQEQGKEEMKNVSKKAPGTLGPLDPHRHCLSVLPISLPFFQHTVTFAREGATGQPRSGRSRRIIIRHESPTHPTPSSGVTLRPGAPSRDHRPPAPAQPEPLGLEGDRGWAGGVLRTWDGP